jgi:hypothetical protein
VGLVPDAVVVRELVDDPVASRLDAKDFFDLDGEKLVDVIVEGVRYFHEGAVVELPDYMTYV